MASGVIWLSWTYVVTPAARRAAANSGPIPSRIVTGGQSGAAAAHLPLAMPQTIRILMCSQSAEDEGYDADVPNKTIYVSEGDLKLYQRAQELAGGNLSAAISGALKRYVDVEEGRLEGFDEIIVRVGVGKKRRKVRFSGVLLGTWATSSSSHPDIYRVYRTRSGKFAVHVDRQEGWDSRTPDGKPAGWRAQLGLQPATWGSRTGSSSIDVYETLDAVREHIPAELYELVADAAQDVVVEDLDI